MRHGLLVAVLSALLCGPLTAHAVEVSAQERQQLLDDAHVKSAAENISSLVLSGQSDKAQFQLQRIKFHNRKRCAF